MCKKYYILAVLSLALVTLAKGEDAVIYGLNPATPTATVGSSRVAKSAPAPILATVQIQVLPTPISKSRAKCYD